MRIWAVLIAAFLLASPARAQKIEAAQAFDRGKALMAEGKTADACAAFETSMRLEPLNGTLYNLGLCHEKLGKLASAWSELKEVSQADSNAARAKDAGDRARALEPRVTRMRLVGPVPAGVVVKRDNVDVTAYADQPTPIDPGTYTFEISGPNRATQSMKVEVRGEGKTVDVSIATLVAGVSEYPYALPLRPLVMPNGKLQLDAQTSIVASDNMAPDPIFAQLGGRMGIGPVELEARAQFNLRYEEVAFKPNPLATAEIMARYAFTPMFYAGLEYAWVRPFGMYGLHGFELRALGARKWLVHPRVALVGGGGLRYSERQGSSGKLTALSLLAQGRAQLMIFPWLSAEALTNFGVHIANSSLYDGATELTVGANVVVVVRRDIDVYAQAYAELLPTAVHRTFLLGMAYRRDVY